MLGRLMFVVAVFAFAGLPRTAGAASEALLTAAGRIVDVSDSERVVVLRGSSKVPAKYAALLYPGDRFEFNGYAKVTADVHESREIFDPGSAMKVIPARPGGFFNVQDSQLLDNFSALLSRPRKAIPVSILAKSGGEERAGLEGAPVAPQGLQYILRGTSRVALVWRGGPARLTLQGKSGASSSVDSGRSWWAVLPLVDGNAPYDVSAQGQPLRWTIEVVDACPAPPWFVDGQEAGESRRLVRAAWLLRDGPPQWRVFALSELANLAAGGHYLARELWTAARNGELEAEVSR